MKRLFKKRTGMILSVVLIVVGIIVGTCGFGMARFDRNRLPQDGHKPWYQTIAVSNQSWWFGVQIGSNSIVSIS